jgi:hypothetical protein
VRGIFRDEFGGVDGKGDEITVVNDWADMSEGETADDTGEKVGAELGGWGTLSGWVFRCSVGGAGGGPRESARTVTVGRAGS